MTGSKLLWSQRRGITKYNMAYCNRKTRDIGGICKTVTLLTPHPDVPSPDYYYAGDVKVKLERKYSTGDSTVLCSPMNEILSSYQRH